MIGFLLIREWHGFWGGELVGLVWGLVLFLGNAMGLPRLAGRKAEPIDGRGGGDTASAAVSLQGTEK